MGNNLHSHTCLHECQSSGRNKHSAGLEAILVNSFFYGLNCEPPKFGAEALRPPGCGFVMVALANEYTFYPRPNGSPPE